MARPSARFPAFLLCAVASGCASHAHPLVPVAFRSEQLRDPKLATIPDQIEILGAKLKGGPVECAIW